MLLTQIKRVKQPPLDWHLIYYDWLNWGLSLDDWYEFPDWFLYNTWIGVKQSKLKEHNANNHSSSYVAYFVYDYLRDKQKSEPLKPNDFLPYDLTPLPEGLTVETAKEFIKASEENLLSPVVEKMVIDCGLMESILKLSKKDLD